MIILTTLFFYFMATPERSESDLNWTYEYV